MGHTRRGVLEKLAGWREESVSGASVFYLPGPPPQLCKPHSSCHTDAHLMVQPRTWEGQERRRKKHRREMEGNHTAHPGISFPLQASTEPWLVSGGGTEDGQRTQSCPSRHNEPKRAPGEMRCWAGSCPSPGTEQGGGSAPHRHGNLQGRLHGCIPARALANHGPQHGQTDRQTGSGWAPLLELGHRVSLPSEHRFADPLWGSFVPCQNS